MKKTIQSIAFAAALLFGFSMLATSSLHAQATGPQCDPCTSPWTGKFKNKFVFSIPTHPNCSYTAYVVYQVRSCFDKTQFEITSAVIEDQGNGGSVCKLGNADTYELNKAITAAVLYLVDGSGRTVIKTSPSSCYYTAKVTVPKEAAICMGINQNSTCTVLMPCDPMGCCYAHLTAARGRDGEPTYYQEVIKSSICPPRAVVLDEIKIEWSCTLGGFHSYEAKIEPDAPLMCNDVCSVGLAKAGTTGIADEAEAQSWVNVFPNPFRDFIDISVVSAQVKDEISIEIFDLSGKLVLNRKEKADGRQNIRIDTHELAGGVYICTVTCGKQQYAVKINK